MTTSDPSPLPRRWPLLPTLLVAAAVATMIALGVWQIDRAREKNAIIALYTANLARPPVAFPVAGPVPDDALFRTSSANCLSVSDMRPIGGRSTTGTTGYRFLATCKRGVEGPGFIADIGLAEDPQYRPTWTGGMVEGVITLEPVEGGLWASLTGTAPVPRPMLVATNPPPGLMASAAPDPSGIANNHIAYAVQWFLFAIAAAVIYVLAVRLRWKKAQDAATPDA
jgi:surfeit locus 1 family protein